MNQVQEGLITRKMQFALFTVTTVALISSVALGIEVSKPIEIYSLQQSGASSFPSITALHVSPDGKEILFDVSDTIINNKNNPTIGEIQTLNTSTGTSRFIAYGQGSNWSPDGKRIIYFGNSENLISDTDSYTGQFRFLDTTVYIMNEDGEKTTIRNFSHSIGSIEWSPDGKRFAYVLTALGYNYIYTINVDGTNIKRLTDKTLDPRGAPLWSSDGSTIAFSSVKPVDKEWFKVYVYTIDVNGTKITNTTKDGFPLAWSHNGKKILNWGGPGIYMMNADGSNQEAITNTITNKSLAADFSPDDKAIYYSTSDKIYRLDIIG
jgi:Tol biopolymer transport system component